MGGALSDSKNPMLPFKLAMGLRRTGWERGRVNFRLKFSFIIQVIIIRKKLKVKNNNQHAKISRFFLLSPTPSLPSHSGTESSKAPLF